MITEENKQKYQKDLEKLRNAASELLIVFQTQMPNTIEVDVHLALFHVARAMLNLEQLMEKQ